MSALMQETASGKEFTWLDTTYLIKTTAGETGGAIGIFESTMPPGAGPPLHVHHGEDEIFYVIEGTLECWMDGRSVLLGTGGTIFLPRDIPHTFRAVGDGPARMLTHLVPGGFEGFFPEVAEKAYRVPADMEPLAALAANYRLEFLGPAPCWE